MCLCFVCVRVCVCFLASARSSCKCIRLDRILLETDSPYLPPVPFRGKRNESAYVRHVAEHISELFVQPLHEIAAITTRNAMELFGGG